MTDEEKKTFDKSYSRAGEIKVSKYFA